jgi:hypothetical protein
MGALGTVGTEDGMAYHCGMGEVSTGTGLAWGNNWGQTGLEGIGRGLGVEYNWGTAGGMVEGAEEDKGGTS